MALPPRLQSAKLGAGDQLAHHRNTLAQSGLSRPALLGMLRFLWPAAMLGFPLHSCCLHCACYASLQMPGPQHIDLLFSGQAGNCIAGV